MATSLRYVQRPLQCRPTATAAGAARVAALDGTGGSPVQYLVSSCAKMLFFNAILSDTAGMRVLKGLIFTHRCHHYFAVQDKSEEMLGRLIDAFDQLAGRRIYHMIGNHCLYNLPRHKLHEMLQIPPAADGASYYSFSPHPAWRFVVIDAYDISLLGWPETHPRHLQAEAILERENPNEVSSILGS